MSVPTKEQIAKLPVWAQKHIENLERGLNRVRLDLASERDRPESPFKYNDNGAWDKWHNLPEDHSIRIVLADKRYIDIRLASDRDSCQEPAIYLSANNGVRIQPESHNTCFIIPEKR